MIYRRREILRSYLIALFKDGAISNTSDLSILFSQDLIEVLKELVKNGMAKFGESLLGRLAELQGILNSHGFSLWDAAQHLYRKGSETLKR